jgi:ataxia telangiectasia mutated family protein
MRGAGVEGVMRKCCEETLRVLRTHKESLLTIVEVFIHDPLYKWALTPAGAQQRQAASLDGATGGPSGPQWSPRT